MKSYYYCPVIAENKIGTPHKLLELLGIYDGIKNFYANFPDYLVKALENSKVIFQKQYYTYGEISVYYVEIITHLSEIILLGQL